MVHLATKDNADLIALAQRLLKDGPVQTHPAGRRIRVKFHGVDIVDCLDATFVWEHRGFPFVYVPLANLSERAEVSTSREIEGPNGSTGARLLSIRVGDAGATDRAVHFMASGPLEGLVKIEPAAVDAVYEEDAPIEVHPRDPFKRIDTLPSSREVRVQLPASAGPVTLVPGARFSVHLLETLLPARYYLPLTAVDTASDEFYLRPSEKRSVCPYKGEASYYDVVVRAKDGRDEEVWKDLVWYYLYPRAECASIAGLACFYNEKLDIWLDGVKEKRPVTHFA